MLHLTVERIFEMTGVLKKWERSPLFTVMFLLNSLWFIFRFGRVYPQPHPTEIFGYLNFQFNHRNIKFIHFGPSLLY